MTDTPTIVAPASFTLPSTVALVIGAKIGIVDPWAAGNPGTLHIKISCQHGRLHFPHQPAGTVVEADLTLADMDAALHLLAYTALVGTTDTVAIEVWNQAGNVARKAVAIIPHSIEPSPPVPPPPLPPSPPSPPSPPPVGNTVPRAASFARMLAVNTHIDFGIWGLTPAYVDRTKVARCLNYLWELSSVHALARDFAGDNLSMGRWRDIANGVPGLRFFAGIGECRPDEYAAFIDRALTAPDLLAGLCGPNEEDSAVGNGVAGGLTMAQSLDAAAAYMPTLYQRAHATGLPLLNMSYGQGWAPPDYNGNYGSNGDLSASCDFGSAHTYPPNGDPPRAQIDKLNALAARAAPNRRVAIDEFGYKLDEVPEPVRARYALCAWADAWAAGNSLFAWYALFDDMSGPWGLFNDDGRPRLTATAFRNLLAVLADKGLAASTFTLRPFGHSVTGGPSGLRHFALQKSTGENCVVIWNEQKIPAGSLGPVVNVVLTLSRTAIVRLYDPIGGIDAPVMQWEGIAGNVAVPTSPVVAVVS